MDAKIVEGYFNQCLELISSQYDQSTIMSNLSNFQHPPPKNWQDFESLCHDLWKEIWKDPNAQKNGRSGQEQHGVDVFGQPN